MSLVNWMVSRRDGRRPVLVSAAWIGALLLGATGNAFALQVAIVEHVIPSSSSYPQGITRGPDGGLWFTEYGANQIGHVGAGSTVTEFPVPTANSAPNGITTGPDGALWFTEYFGNKIGRMTVDGAITEYPLPVDNSYPARIATGPDGALWFTEFNGHRIGRVTTQGVIVEYNLADGSYPVEITAGPDGALWFTESTANKIGRITTTGMITEFAVPTPDSSPGGIAAGSDGALWFTEQSGNKIGRISVSGTITEYPSGGGPISITPGPDGALWFTENYGVKIGRITTAGAITEFPVPTAGYLQGIIAGPGGGIWFTENSANRIAQVLHQTALLTAAPAQSTPGKSVTLSGTGFAANDSVTIADDVGPYRTATADGSGAFSITGPLRPAPFGPNSFVAVGQTSHNVAVAKVTIAPRLFATPSVVTAGSQMTIQGLGFSAVGSVDMYVDDFVFAGSGPTDIHGSVAGNNAVKITIPSSLPAGIHFISGTGATYNETARAYFTVE